MVRFGPTHPASLLDNAASDAIQSPQRVKLFEWRCDANNGRCLIRMAVLWSTPAGTVFYGLLPFEEKSTAERKALRMAGVPDTHDGVRVISQFITNLKAADEMVVVCKQHGPQTIHAETGYSVYRLPQ